MWRCNVNLQTLQQNKPFYSGTYLAACVGQLINSQNLCSKSGEKNVGLGDVVGCVSGNLCYFSRLARPTATGSVLIFVHDHLHEVSCRFVWLLV